MMGVLHAYKDCYKSWVQWLSLPEWDSADLEEYCLIWSDELLMDLTIGMAIRREFHL